MIRTRLAFLFLVLTLSACGGGGGGGGGGAGGGSGGGSTLNVSVGSLDFTANRFEPPPPTQSFTVSWTGANVAGFVSGVPPGETVPPWLDISTVGTTSPVTVNVSILYTDLALGTYTVTLRVVTGDASANPIRSVDVPLTFTVTDNFRAAESAFQTDRILGSTRSGGFRIELLGDGISWTGSTDQPWVTLAQTSGTTPIDFNVFIDSSTLPVGATTATATFVNDADPLDTVDIVFTIDVSPPSVILRNNPLNDPTLTFSGTNGVNIDDQPITIELDNEQPTTWVVTPSDPWIVPVSLEPGLWPWETRLTVDVDPSAANLASGDYTGELEVSTTYGGFTMSDTIPIVLSLVPPVPSLLESSFTFSGALPTDFVAQELEFVPRVQSGFVWEFDLSYDNGSDWLTATPMMGVTEGNIVPSTMIQPVTEGLPEDRYTGSIDFTLFVNGDVITDSVPVEVIVEPNRLAVPDNGVALMTSPGLAKLSQTVTVTDHRKLSVPWTAASDQPWLSVTPSGTTDGDLVLTADPTGLAAEAIYYATVTVDSTDPSISNTEPETIRVGLYVTGLTPAAEINVPVPETGRTVTGLAADPIRPYAYMTSASEDIEVYNIFTGVLIDTISIPGAGLRSVTVSSDGSRLYAMDHSNIVIVTVDLDDLPLTANSPWTGPPWLCGSCNNITREVDLHYTRVNGQKILLAGNSNIIDAETGVLIGNAFGGTSSGVLSTSEMEITASGGVVFLPFGSTSSLTRYALSYSYIDGTFSLTESHRGGNIPIDMDSDPSGDRLFGGCDAPAGELSIYSGHDLSVLSSRTGGGASTSIFGPDGLVYCARYSSLTDPNAVDVWAIDPDTRVINREFRVPGRIAERRFTLSGDGLRLITRSDDQAVLSFLTTQ